MEKQVPQSKISLSLQKKEIDYAQLALAKLKSIMDWSPRDLFEHLEGLGYIGQDEARRRLCLIAYRHVRRLKDHYLRNIDLEDLPSKSNVLMLGPTGSGKTYLTQLLFGTILQLPVVTVDMTGFVETGYVGRQVPEILSGLLGAAQDNPSWAKMGICVLDEFDKLAGAGSPLRFGGAGTTKDVSGYGVQRSLLKLIEGGTHEPTSTSAWEQQTPSIDTDCVGFVACGAFSGLQNLIPSNQHSSFGFSSNNNTSKNHKSEHNPVKNDTIEPFTQYGFLPELIGRFSSICHLNPLGHNELMAILKKNVLPKYKQEFEREGQTFDVPTKVMNGIIDQAIERKTGARGIALLLEEYFEETAFKSFGKKDNNRNNDIDIPF